MGQSNPTRLSIPDGELALEVLGDGPPLLMVAGLGGRRQFWREQAPRYAQRYRVVLHDHRGTGESSRWQGPFSIAQMANDVLALMDGLDIERASIVGHSTGGAIAQHLAIHAPARLDQIVLSATWAGPDPHFTAMFDVRRRILERCGVDPYLSDGTLRAVPPRWLSSRPDFLEQTRDERRRAFPGKTTELARIDAVVGHDLRAVLGDITSPVEIIVAADDQITPPHLSQELADRIPRARLRLVESGGHFAPLTNPSAYAQTLSAALNK